MNNLALVLIATLLLIWGGWRLLTGGIHMQGNVVPTALGLVAQTVALLLFVGMVPL